MDELTEDGRRLVEEIAARHGFSADAVRTLLQAVASGGGSQAQFSHPELGGIGQWSKGGMIMIGDMFNNELKSRVDRLAEELSGLLGSPALARPAPSASKSGREGIGLFAPGGSFSVGNWPPELGQPSSAGGQNDLHYAYFPDSRRLAVRKGGHITLYDTEDHRIGGVSQAQGGGQTLVFTSQHGTLRLDDLKAVGAPEPAERDSPRPPQPASRPGPAAEPDRGQGQGQAPGQGPGQGLDLFAQIERLAELHKKGILTDAEFAQKKAEMLARL